MMIHFLVQAYSEESLTGFIVRILMNNRVSFDDLMKARARRIVIVDHSASLKVGIDRDCADILEAALFQIPADPVGKPVADRNAAFGMTVINDGFTICVCPQIIAETAEFLTYLLTAPCVADDGTDLAL